MAEPVLSPLGIYELRYLRKQIRYLTNKRETPPPRHFEGTGYEIKPERAQEIDEIAKWIVQRAAQ